MWESVGLCAAGRGACCSSRTCASSRLEPGVSALQVQDGTPSTSGDLCFCAPLGVRRGDLQSRSPGRLTTCSLHAGGLLHSKTKGEEEAPGIQSAPIKARTRSCTAVSEGAHQIYKHQQSTRILGDRHGVSESNCKSTAPL